MTDLAFYARYVEWCRERQLPPASFETWQMTLASLPTVRIVRPESWVDRCAELVERALERHGKVA